MINLHYEIEHDVYVGEDIETIVTGEFDYEVEPTKEDYVDYLMETERFASIKKDWADKQTGSIMRDTIEALLDYYDWLKDGIDEDEGFVNYLHDAYEDEAMDAYND